MKFLISIDVRCDPFFFSLLYPYPIKKWLRSTTENWNNFETFWTWNGLPKCFTFSKIFILRFVFLLDKISIKKNPKEKWLPPSPFSTGMLNLSIALLHCIDPPVKTLFKNAFSLFITLMFFGFILFLSQSDQMVDPWKWYISESPIKLMVTSLARVKGNDPV